MTIHPIESRYRTDEMARLFTEEHKLEKWLDVEAALAIAHAEVGNVPTEAAEKIKKKATLKFVKLERVKEIEKEIDHDIMAMVRAIAETCDGDSGNYVHLGATSYDVVDTAWSLVLRDALKILKEKILKLKKISLDQARKHQKTICIGRTHGQHAIPTTYGMKFAGYATEFQRHGLRIDSLLENNIVGKMSGAVGTMASFGDKGFKIQESVMKQLGIKISEISTQIVPRDLHAEIFAVLALIGTTLSKIAKEIRNLQRTEIAEVFEPYSKKQVGSSTMATKRNPHKVERICGINRIIQSNLLPILENAALMEHERDLSNSSVERIIFPETFILLDYILSQMVFILEGLEFNKNNIDRNLQLTGGQIFAENIMIKLVEKGLSRQKVHERLRTIGMKCRQEGKPFKEGILTDKELSSQVSEKELDEWLDPKNYIGTAIEQVERILKKYKD